MDAITMIRETHSKALNAYMVAMRHIIAGDRLLDTHLPTANIQFGQMLGLELAAAAMGEWQADREMTAARVAVQRELEADRASLEAA